MAPSVTMNMESDFVTPKPRSFDSLSPSRSLLLSPPSLSSHPEKLNKILAAYDRAITDIQMLDRLSLSLVCLPDSTYDNILILLDADGTRRESEKLLNRDVFCHIAKALKPNGRLKSQDGTFALTDTVERREAIFAGLLIDKNEMAKPGHEATQSVPLRFGRTQGEHGATTVSQTASTTDLPLNKNGKRTSELSDATPLSGVGFVEFGDDLDDAIEESDNEELIDEDTLLNDEDLTRPIIQPPSCRPPTGKRRRACKDCTCGLAQRLEAEDSAKRSTADQNLAKLNTSDLAEVDFTVQGKVGSCGNCALGDAFRCDGCPYIGLPAFKNGEVVRLEEGEGNVHL